MTLILNIEFRKGRKMNRKQFMLDTRKKYERKLFDVIQTNPRMCILVFQFRIILKIWLDVRNVLGMLA